MRGRRHLFLKLVIILCGGPSASMSHCDMSTTARVKEGNLGQTPIFNWLGVLRVHLHDADTVQVAVSGIVLIKIKHAIINADDIARIPQRIFQTDSRAMFLQAADTPWYVPPVSYVTHPEYEYSTTNTIAIIELNIDAAENYPLNPICLPSSSFDATSNLYLTGYTDENKLLEKVLYKIQYLTIDTCEEFYNRAGLSDRKRVPSTYICGYAPYNRTQCIWDNGMALVSNATGYFTLIGFGIRGPGCSAPARFINMQPYFHWINSATTSAEEMYDSPDYRRIDDTEYVPAHELFTMNTSRRQDNIEQGGLMREYEPYPFKTTRPSQFTIEEIDDNAIIIFPFNETYEMYNESCKAYRVLLYREYFEINSPDVMGYTTFKLSMYDLIHRICVCVELTIDCVNRTDATLAFKEEFSFIEGTRFETVGDDQTPEELFRFYPITERSIKEPGKWKPNANLVPNTIKLNVASGTVANYDLFIRFQFYDQAILKFSMYGTRDEPKFDLMSTPAPDVRAKLRKNKKGKKSKKKYEWGIKDSFDKRVKEPVVSLVAEHADMQETVSKGSLLRTWTLVALVLGHFVCSFWLSHVIILT